MRRKIFSVFICAALLLTCSAQALALDVPEYRFGGAKNDELYDPSGVVTAKMGAQTILPDDTREAVLPYGVSIIGASYAGSATGGVSMSGVTTIGADGYPDVWSVQSASAQPSYLNESDNFVQSGYSSPAADVTQAMLQQNDDSLGTLSIPAIKVNAKIFENDMSKGVGHIPGTAFWNGNAGIMGHNRGINNYFANLKGLTAGDVITYTTNQGTRSYVVTFVGAISETDWSWLQPTADNRLTLISCVMNTPSQRQCVQAAAVG